MTIIFDKLDRISDKIKSRLGDVINFDITYDVEKKMYVESVEISTEPTISVHPNLHQSQHHTHTHKIRNKGLYRLIDVRRHDGAQKFYAIANQVQEKIIWLERAVR